MALSPTPIAGIILVGGIACAAAVFGLLNWRWLDERRLLEREGIAAVARIDAATISHKACNSSVRISWLDAQAVRHSGHYMSCAANRAQGETIGILYLPRQPDTAMIAEGQGGLPDAQFRTGVLIGALVGALMSAVTVQLALRGLRSDPGR